MKRLVFCISFLLLVSFMTDVIGQNVRRFQNIDNSLSLEDNLNVGNELYNNGQYFTAADFFQKVLAEDEVNEEAISKLAQIHYQIRDFNTANQFFKKLLDVNANSYPMMRFHYGTSLKSVGEYNRAIDEFKQYIEHNSADQEHVEKANWEIQSCQLALHAQDNPGDVKISITDPENNKRSNKFAAIRLADKSLLFTGVNSINKQKKTIVAEIEGVYDVMYSNRLFIAQSPEVNIAEAEMLKIKLPNENMSIGSPFLTEDNEKLYYTICGPGNNDCTIYHSEKKSKGKWSDPIKMSDPINVEGANSKNLVIGKDDFNQQLMFFASDRKGGKGGYDIWYVKMDEDGKLSGASNLGEGINTAKHEITPFFDNKSNLLFFSSNGHKGLGEFDVYMATIDLVNHQGKVYNMGHPINSSVDDYYFNVFEGGKSGLITSNRIGAVLANQNSAVDNIYQLTFNEPFTYKNLPDYLTEVNAFDEDDTAFKLFNESFDYKDLANTEDEGSKISTEDIAINGSIFDDNGASKKVTVYLLDENNKVVDSTYTDDEGKFRFRKLNAGQDYAISYDGHQDTQANMTFFDSEGNAILSVNSEDNKRYFRYGQLTTQDTNLAKMDEDNVNISGALLGDIGDKANRKVNLYDENGNLVASTTTDQEGKFRFKSLTSEKDYAVGFDGDDNVKANMTFFDSEGNEIRSVDSENDKHFFKFNRLKDQSTQLTQLSEDNTSISGELLMGEAQQSNQQVKLIDGDGNVAATTTTDENGKFRFRNLDGGTDYSLKFDGNDDTSANMTFFDTNGNKVLAVNSNEDEQYFDYRKLADQKNELTKLVEENGYISGALSVDNKGANARRVILSDGEGNNLAEATTDDNGEFKFKNLPSSSKYVLKMQDEDNLMASMDFFDQEDNLLMSTNSENNKDNFRFESLDDIKVTTTAFEAQETGYVSNSATSPAEKIIENTNREPVPTSTEKTTAPSLNKQVPSQQLKSLFKWTMTYSEYEQLLTNHGNSIEKDINLRVQIGAFRNPSKGLFKNLNLGQIDKVNSKGLTKYLIGSFDKLNEAEILRKKAFDRGVNDAFVSVYYKGARIAILIYDNKNNLVRKYEEGKN